MFVFHFHWCIKAKSLPGMSVNEMNLTVNLYFCESSFLAAAQTHFYSNFILLNHFLIYNHYHLICCPRLFSQFHNCFQ